MGRIVIPISLACAVLFSASLCLSAETYQPAEVKVVGDLDYGQTSDPVECTDSPRYRAFVFTGNSRDRIEVTVKSDGRKAFVAIADGGMKELVSGTTHVTLTLPDKGPDAEAYYIIFRDSDNKAGNFTVELKKVAKETVAKLRPNAARPANGLPFQRQH